MPFYEIMHIRERSWVFKTNTYGIIVINSTAECDLVGKDVDVCDRQALK